MNPAWQKIATFILRSRIPILIVLGLSTAFMYVNRGTELVQAFSEMILSDDPEIETYRRFQATFGDDANLLVVSMDGNFDQLERYQSLYDLSEDLRQVDGVNSVLSQTKLYDVARVDSPQPAFKLVPLVQHRPSTQAELDSIKLRLENLPFYKGLLINDSTQTSILAVALDPDRMNTAEKVELVSRVRDPIRAFGEANQVEVRFSGLPAVRANVHETIKVELYLFLGIALIVTAITLLLFFRSLYTVIFPMLVLGCVIIFSVGIVGLLGYKLSLLTGIIPALVTVISIPNSVYLITKYHIEYLRTRNKMKSLIMVIEKIGIVTVMTNATTAIGLGVLSFTEIKTLQEFGIVAGLSVVSAFFISLLLIPIVFSFLPPPNHSQTKHLQRKGLTFAIKALNNIVMNNRPAVYVVTALVVGMSVWGMTRILPIAYMVDDIPEDSEVYRDLKYIEQRFNGALPFEILVDTKRPRGVFNIKTIEQVSELQDSLATYADISRSMSVADFTKFFRQAFFGGDSEQYLLPTKNEFEFIRNNYLPNTSISRELSQSKNLVDSASRITRISASVRDIGSLAMENLVDSIKQDIDAVFDTARYEVKVTGTTRMFIKANEALIDNLLQSLFLAFVVIAILMGFLFQSFRMVVISLIPNLLPLLAVAGIMGFAGIYLKPSTALVFGVAFGIAVDDSIHFLARYRLARRMGDSIKEAISNSFKDTGVSMIYTSLILFFGFISFTFSEFGGTQALGLLTSITLGIAMFSNLIFLPVLLISFDREKKQVPDALRRPSPNPPKPSKANTQA